MKLGFPANGSSLRQLILSMQTTVPSAKKWWQISLRTLLLSITAICILLALVLGRARDQQKAVRAIEKVYGRVYYDYHLMENGQIEDRPATWVPQWLSRGLAKHVVHPVVYVDLDSELVTDATLAEVAKLRHLKILHIANTSITNDGLRVLQALPELRVVTLNTEGITDEAMEHLATCQSLEEVLVENAVITDSGLMQLTRARRLKRLSLLGSKITPRGLLHFHLDLPNCVVEEW